MGRQFTIHDTGDVTDPDGYSVRLSAVVITMTKGLSAEYAARIRRTLCRYVNHFAIPLEKPGRVLEEPASEAVERVKAFFAAQGIPIVPSKRPNCEHELELVVPDGRSTAHAQQQVGILRQFYQLCGSYSVGARTAENPIEVPGWHLKSEEERRESWAARHPKRLYAWKYAGLRFRTHGRKEYLPLIEDPRGCAELMTRAVVAYGCSASVIAICMTLQENGCRWREAARVNALGWSIKGFGAIVLTTNKGDAREHAKKLVLNPEVEAELVRRFEALPHPTEPARTMMDHLRELAAQGDRAALRRIPLFPNSRGDFHKHRTFNGHWFRPAMEAWENEDGSKGLVIRSDVSARRPTPHWYRHAAISDELEIAITACKTDQEVIDVCRRVCRSFGLKTDQAKRYAAALMNRIADEVQMRLINERRIRNAARRSGSDVPTSSSWLELSESEALVLGLPVRQKIPT